MNYLKLKESIEKAIHAYPMEVEPYNDFFDLCREYEKIDFAVAHEWNHNMRVYIGWALRSAVERADFTAAERFDNLLFRSLLFGAPHFFDDYLQAVEYGKPLDKGMNDFAIAGIMGNIYAESGFKPTNLQNTYEKKMGYTDASYTAAVDDGSYTNFVKDSAGYGLVQWTYWSRKQALLEYARSVGKSIGDLSMQLDFMWKEMQGYSAQPSIREASPGLLRAMRNDMVNPDLRSLLKQLRMGSKAIQHQNQ